MGDDTFKAIAHKIKLTETPGIKWIVHGTVMPASYFEKMYNIEPTSWIIIDDWHDGPLPAHVWKAEPITKA